VHWLATLGADAGFACDRVETTVFRAEQRQQTWWEPLRGHHFGTGFSMTGKNCIVFGRREELLVKIQQFHSSQLVTGTGVKHLSGATMTGLTCEPAS
jgi:hypothetical protein